MPIRRQLVEIIEQPPCMRYTNCLGGSRVWGGSSESSLRVRRSGLRRGAAWLYRRLVPRASSITPLWMPPTEAKAITPASQLAELFYRHQGRPIHKWTHYLELYSAYFERFRGTEVRMLEIGVFEGGSLELWRQFLGDEALIYGIDIDPACASKVDAPNQVRIGSQDDPQFLRSVVAEMGGVDLILDDGSHRGHHIITSFRTLFPLLSDGGLYVIEDMHDDFSEFPGTRRSQSLSFLKRLIDDMHGRYTGLNPQESANVGGMHLFDSIAFLEKKVVREIANTVVPAR